MMWSLAREGWELAGRSLPTYRRSEIPTEISGVTFDEAWATREPAVLDGERVHFIGRDAFLRNKRAAGRPQDLADAERLKR